MGETDGAVPDDSTPSMVGRPGALLPAGTAVGRYVALDVLGQGGMGVVYRAWDPTLSRAIALKLVDAPSNADRPIRERLLREAQALAQLSHANVVAIHDVGTTDTGVFIAMELVEGKTLMDWLAVRARGEREILGALLQAGDGLAAAHEKGIIHRDFKPANVMIGDDGRARVLDFGLARAVEPMGVATPQRSAPVVPAPDSHLDQRPPRALTASTARLDTLLTQAGAILGTPRYMSPEQHAGETASEASDQFSFCVAAWEALFRQHPFPADTRKELLRKQRAGEITRPVGARVSARVEQALRRGMAAEPADRHRSLAALLEELRHDPVRRRRVVLAVVAAVATAGLLGAGWLRGERALPLCAVDPAALAGVWDADRRAAVERAFAATATPGAADAFASVALAVDRYAAGWVQMRHDACLATRVRGDQSERLMDLRMQCLDRRRDGLRAQIDVFAAADRVVVGRAAEAARALAPIDECADATLLEAAVPLPADPRVRERATALTRSLVRVQAQLAAGLYDDGVHAVDPIEKEVRQLELRPLMAEVEVTHGRLLDRRGDYRGAEKEYWAAVADADAGRVDLLRAEALTQLVWMIGERDAHYEDARQLASVARGAIDRLDRPDRVLARYYRSLGVLDYREGKYQQALESSARAAELARRAAGSDDPYVASCVMDVGLAHYYLGDFAQAKLDVEQALAIWKKAFGPTHADVAAAFDNLGEIERAMNHFPEAIADYRAAATIWERLGSFDRADALANIGEIERSQGHLPAAQEDLERAVAVLQQKFGPDHRRLAAPLVGLARVLVEQGHAGDALPLLERALRMEDATPGDPVERADGWLTLARALRALGREPERGHKLATSALELYRTAGARGQAGVVEAQRWLAHTGRRGSDEEK